MIVSYYLCTFNLDLKKEIQELFQKECAKFTSDILYLGIFTYLDDGMYREVNKFVGNPFITKLLTKNILHDDFSSKLSLFDLVNQKLLDNLKYDFFPDIEKSIMDDRMEYFYPDYFYKGDYLMLSILPFFNNAIGVFKKEPL